ncbi:hypothetical protein SLEP1_g47683 [Rubroshorea leprosula]|uniref:Disease resistance RPP13-like protein 1 n=1 Tax=Rubroshorea leprosula TaxID=152421 RepID=A0AAV5LT23_9ROSI|nr:hypothetical protein SLEP1_g47683 [Rubroshorea leprosula]
MEVGAALVASAVEWLIDKLKSEVTDWFESRKEARDALENWKDLLPNIRDVLEDAETKQLTNNAVKTWLSELRDIAYDMEDILRGDEADAQRQKLNLKTCDQARTNRVRKLIPTLSCDFKVDRETMSKIKGITDRLKNIKARRDALDLKIEHGTNRAVTQRILTTGVPESHFFGREKDKDAILRKLSINEDNTKCFSVIPIVGMGGLGKTTLASLVYNDEELKVVFGPKAWVCVSNEFDDLRIAISILDQLNVKSDSKDPAVIHSKLKEMLSGQKFLLVLDDVWNNNYHLWSRLQGLFMSGAPGSKIIVTTRDEKVARSMRGDGWAYHLDLFPDNECLSLLAKHALETENFDSYGHLKGIGEEIVKKCKGLPLAITTIGGLLRGDQLNPNKWRAVLNNEIWKVSEEIGGVLPALRLSYHHLPSHLKQCFAFCAIFPNDFELDENDLVLLWMAQGFLRQHQQIDGVKEMKSLGHQYFCDLLLRSFFQRPRSNSSLFVMHDLVIELARDVASETCYQLDMSVNKKLDVTRHFSFSRGEFDTYQRFEMMEKMKSLRTFLPTIGRYRSNYLSNKVVHYLFSNLRCLRVLSFNGYLIKKVPDSIGDLKLLCYINLSGTAIQSLPDSVSFLVYLQTLILRSCGMLTQLPEGIVNLVDLLHLDIAHTTRLKELPSGIGKLTNLLTLPKFVIGGGLRLGELKNLKQLQGDLLISNLHKVSDFRDASEANLHAIEGLDELILQWTGDFQTSRNVSNENKVLCRLKPHCNLKRFTIEFFGGLEFPSWIGDPSFFKLEYLKLCDCQNITLLPPLGQLPLLKKLIIRGMPEFTGNNSFSGSFSSLEKLTLEDCPKLIGKLPSHLPFLKILMIRNCPQLSYSLLSLPSLEKLTLLDCPKLIGKLPSHLPFLKVLMIRDCPQLSFSLLSLPSLGELKITGCSEAILRNMRDVTCLTSLQINRIPKLACLHKSITQFLTVVETVDIEECDELTCLWEDGASLASLKCLRELSIQNCKKIVRFPVTGLPLHLKKLQLEDLVVLESLPDGLMKIGDGGNNMLQLEELVIKGCEQLKSFPRDKLPSTLKMLKIKNCENLESLPEVVNLEHLQVNNLPSLKCFPSSKLPSALKRLKIKECQQLESLPDRLLQDCTQLEEMQIKDVENLRSLPIDFMHNLSGLVELELNSCEGFKSLPEMDLSSIPKLKTLKIQNLENLKSLPNKMWNLTSIQCLIIWHCPGVTSIPEGGFPLNLKTLKIVGEGLSQSMLEWGLDRLTSLESFEIGEICPPNNLQLPKSLKSLTIQWSNLKSIPKVLLQNLHSLENLYFNCCPELQSLPTEGLPTSLQWFVLSHCPLLKEWWLKEKEDYWSLIANIPYVDFYP